MLAKVKAIGRGKKDNYLEEHKADGQGTTVKLDVVLVTGKVEGNGRGVKGIYPEKQRPFELSSLVLKKRERKRKRICREMGFKYP